MLTSEFITFSDNSLTLYSFAGKYVVDLNQEDEAGVKKLHQMTVISVKCFGPSFIVSASLDQYVGLWNWETQELLLSLSTDEGLPWGLDVAGSRLLVGISKTGHTLKTFQLDLENKKATEESVIILDQKLKAPSRLYCIRHTEDTVICSTESSCLSVIHFGGHVEESKQDDPIEIIDIGEKTQEEGESSTQKEQKKKCIIS